MIIVTQFLLTYEEDDYVVEVSEVEVPFFSIEQSTTKLQEQSPAATAQQLFDEMTEHESKDEAEEYGKQFVTTDAHKVFDICITKGIIVLA